jgi:hypothetical protein
LLFIGALHEVFDVKIIEFLLSVFSLVFLLMRDDFDLLFLKFEVVHLLHSSLSIFNLLKLNVGKSSRGSIWIAFEFAALDGSKFRKEGE